MEAAVSPFVIPYNFIDFNIIKMKQKLTIIKVGGAVVEDEQQLAQLLKDFSAIEGRKVLVHGGGRRAESGHEFHRKLCL